MEESITDSDILKAIKKCLIVGNFTSHSGLVLPWKFEIEKANNDDCTMFTTALDLPSMRTTGIDTGGTYLLRQSDRIHHFYTTECLYTPYMDYDTILVDDVTTTGASFIEARNALEKFGYRVTEMVCIIDRRNEVLPPGHSGHDLDIRSLVSIDSTLQT